MSEPVQRRARATRANLTAAASAIVAREGYHGLRVDQVVKAAGVAKGTFFAHYPDKDALMERLLAERLTALLDDVQTARRPASARALAGALGPVLSLLTCERYVFELVQRAVLSASGPDGAAAGPLSDALARLDAILVGWFGGLFGAPPFRTDLSPRMMAEGVRALAMQAMAFELAEPSGAKGAQKRLAAYIDAYLMPPG